MQRAGKVLAGLGFFSGDGGEVVQGVVVVVPPPRPPERGLWREGRQLPAALLPSRSGQRSREPRVWQGTPQGRGRGAPG